MLIRKKHIRLASSFMLACTALTIVAPLSIVGNIAFAETTTTQTASTPTPAATRYIVSQFGPYAMPALLYNADGTPQMTYGTFAAATDIISTTTSADGLTKTTVTTNKAGNAVKTVVVVPRVAGDITVAKKTTVDPTTYAKTEITIDAPKTGANSTVTTTTTTVYQSTGQAKETMHDVGSILDATAGQDMAGGKMWQTGDTTLQTASAGAPCANVWSIAQDGTGGDFWVMKTSTLGYENLKLDAQLKASATAPGDFQIEYSTDWDGQSKTGGTWLPVDNGHVEVSTAFNAYYGSGADSTGSGAGIVKDLQLPQSIANQAVVYVRFRASSINTAYTAPGKPGPAIALTKVDPADPTHLLSASNVYLQNPTISGTRYYGATDAKASVDDGTAIPKNQVVTVTVQDKTATVHYSLNGGAEQTTSVAGSDVNVTINDFTNTDVVGNKTAELSAWTVDAEGRASIPIIYHYTQAKLAQVLASKGNGTSLRAGQALTLKDETSSNAKIYYTLTTNVGTDNEATVSEQAYDAAKPLSFAKDQFPVKVQTRATDANYLDSDTMSYSYTLNDTNVSTLKPYFGGLHAHTTFSDGIGVPSDAYASAKLAGLDFEAVTDHSNYFENTNATTQNQLVSSKTATFSKNMNGAKLPDGTNYTYASSTAQQQKDLGFKIPAATDNSFDAGFSEAAAATNTTTDNGNKPFLAVYGFEMTWSSGPGHINTFNMKDADGNNALTSRQNSWYNDKSNNYVCLPRYYDTLANLAPTSISQFNHPGPTFGNFDDFAYWTPQRDSAISLIEAGNGEGKVGDASGYFPSYDQYFLALDKGWHVAPTNGQDNHKGAWGFANDTRTVALMPNLSQANLFDALKNRRVYSTEDKNVAMSYTLNDEIMGTVLDSRPTTVNINAEVNDPDTTKTGDAIKQIDLMVDGGKVIDTKTFSGEHDAKYTYSAPTNYNYYIIRSTEADGDITISAPIWTGTVEKVGVNDIQASQSLALVDQKVTLNTTLYNNEANEFDVSKVTYKDGNTVVNADNSPLVVMGGSTKTLGYDWIPTIAGNHTITVTVEGTMNGEAKTFTKSMQITVKDPATLTQIGMDGTHNNAYVTASKYANSFTSFAKLAAAQNAQVTIEKGDTTTGQLTKAILDKYTSFMITAPELSNPTYKVFTNDEIEALKEWAAEPGKTLVVMGAADYSYDQKASETPQDPDHHTSAQLNKILTAIGAGARMGDDEVSDSLTHGNVTYRLSFTGPDFNITNNDLMNGMNPSQVYSFYSGTHVLVDDCAATDVKVLVKTHEASENPNATVAKTNAAGYVIDVNGTELLDTTGKSTQDPTKVADQTKLVMVPYTGTGAIDGDKDGFGIHEGNVITDIPQGGQAVLTSEILPQSKTRVITAGTAFLSDFEITATTDFAGALPSANTTIAQNLLSEMAPVKVSSISDVLKNGKLGEEFTIVGTLTSHCSDYALANGIKEYLAEGSTYMKDETGSINIFPLHNAQAQKGVTMQITGTLKAYYGEKELEVTSEKIVDATVKDVTPEVVTPGVAVSNASISKYLQSTGTVSNINGEYGDGSFVLIGKDGSVPVRLEGYIGTLPEFVKEGAKVTVTGFGSRYLTGTDQVKDPATGEMVTNMNDTDNDLNLRAMSIKLEAESAEPTKPGEGTKPVEPTKPSTTKPAPATPVLNLPIKNSAFLFKDVSTNPFLNDIKWLYSVGVTTGTASTSFSPSANVTRGQMAAFLYRFAGAPKFTTISNKFKDVNDNQFKNQILWLASKGITTGTTATTYSPNEYVSRGQMAAFLHRFAISMGYAPAGKQYTSSFKDVSQFANDIAWLKSEGITTGYTPTTYQPLRSVSRDQMAAFLHRLYNGLSK